MLVPLFHFRVFNNIMCYSCKLHVVLFVVTSESCFKNLPTRFIHVLLLILYKWLLLNILFSYRCLLTQNYSLESTHVLVCEPMPGKEDLLHAVVAKKPYILSSWVKVNNAQDPSCFFWFDLEIFHLIIWVYWSSRAFMKVFHTWIWLFLYFIYWFNLLS